MAQQTDNKNTVAAYEAFSVVGELAKARFLSGEEYALRLLTGTRCPGVCSVVLFRENKFVVCGSDGLCDVFRPIADDPRHQSKLRCRICASDSHELVAHTKTGGGRLFELKNASNPERWVTKYGFEPKSEFGAASLRSVEGVIRLVQLEPGFNQSGLKSKCRAKIRMISDAEPPLQMSAGFPAQSDTKSEFDLARVRREVAARFAETLNGHAYEREPAASFAQFSQELERTPPPNPSA